MNITSIKTKEDFQREVAKTKSPLKVIRLKCLDCSALQYNEVKLCPVTDCPLYPFREGHNPHLKRKVKSE